MNVQELEAFASEMSVVVREVVAPLLARIEALERRGDTLPTPKDGRDGKDADPSAVAAIVTAELRKEIDGIRETMAALPSPRDGKDGADGAPGNDGASGEKGDKGEPGPPGRDGADGQPGKDGAPGADGRDGAPGLNGKDADPEQVAALVRQEAERILGDWERPRNGIDAPSEEAIKAMVAVAVAAVPKAKDGDPGKDGVGMAGMLIDRDGHLVATMTDGSTRNLGPVVGKDGTDADPLATDRRLREMFDAWPKPKDGKDGKDGKDALGFDDLDVIYDGRKSFSLRFARAADVKEFTFDLPVMIYRGVFKEGESYLPGDMTTFGGSLWHCDQATTEKPEGPAKHWTLCAKRGRDGKDGEIKSPRDPKPVKVG